MLFKLISPRFQVLKGLNVFPKRFMCKTLIYNYYDSKNFKQPKYFQIEDVLNWDMS